jgi:hypothetical protein
LPPDVSQLLPPTRVTVQGQSANTIVSWDPAQAATRYLVLRATHTQTLTGGAHPRKVWIRSNYESIATTNGTFFRDSTAQRGHHYTYVVVAQNQWGQNAWSNIVFVPSQRPPVTFHTVDLEVQDLVRRGKLDARLGAAISAQLVDVQRGSIRAGTVVPALRTAFDGVGAAGMAKLDAARLQSLIAGLGRQIFLAESGVVSRSDL